MGIFIIDTFWNSNIVYGYCLLLHALLFWGVVDIGVILCIFTRWWASSLAKLVRSEYGWFMSDFPYSWGTLEGCVETWMKVFPCSMDVLVQTFTWGHMSKIGQHIALIKWCGVALEKMSDEYMEDNLCLTYFLTFKSWLKIVKHYFSQWFTGCLLQVMLDVQFFWGVWTPMILFVFQRSGIPPLRRCSKNIEKKHGIWCSKKLGP